MRPTLHLGLPSGSPDIRWVLSGPMQGFDALRIVTQIISVQCLHYLALALVLPPLLSLLVLNRAALNFQGGPASLSLLLDWREIAGIPITDGGRAWPWGKYHFDKLSQIETEALTTGGANTSSIDDGFGIRYWWEWEAFVQRDTRRYVKIKSGDSVAWEGRKLGVGSVQESIVRNLIATSGRDKTYGELGWWYALAKDSSRGWVIVLAWAVAGAADVFLLSMLIRRPTHILDHAITLQAIHLALTWCYTRKFPTSLFYWLVMAAHTGACVVWAEALSIRREMQTGFQTGFDEELRENQAERREENRALLAGEHSATSHSASRGSSHMTERPTTHVLFEGDEDNDDADEYEYEHNENVRRGGSKGSKTNGQPHERIEMKRMD